MKKIVLLFIGALILAAGCSNGGKEPPEEIFIDDPLAEMLKEYGLTGKFDDTAFIYINAVNDSLKSFGGKLKNSTKIGLVIINANTKKRLIDIIPFENNIATVEKPYGESTTFTVNIVFCHKLQENDNVIAICVVGMEEMFVSKAVSRYIFITDGKIIKSFDADYCYSEIINNWEHNFIVDDCKGIYLYNPLGEIIEIVNYKDYGYTSQDEILSEFEGIYIAGNTIYRFDLRENYPIWRSIIDLSGIDRPRIDSKSLIGKTNEYYTYEMGYTEYSGNKGTIKFRVDIETGKIEYL